jgi:hypothetical protein
MRMGNSALRSLGVAILLMAIELCSRQVHAQSGGPCEIKLDLTKVVVNSKPGHTIAMGAVSSEDDLNAAPVLPLAVTLVGVDKPTYSINESFVYEMRLTNNSGEAVWLPVSGQPIYRQGEQYLKGYRHIHIEFAILDVNGKDTVADRYTLYGAKEVRGSLRLLKPGRCVALRVPGYLQIYSNQQRLELLEKSATNFMAHTLVYMFDPRDPVYRRSTSPRRSNTVPMTIRGREVPIIEREVLKTAPKAKLRRQR